jgi:hypothetical protein
MSLLPSGNGKHFKRNPFADACRLFLISNLESRISN